jgi:hypothetical protein
MGFKADITIDSSRLKKIIKDKQELIHHNIVTVVRTEAFPHLIDLIMDGYDSLSDRMSGMPEDPTNPAYWRTEFKAKLDEDLERNLIVTDKGLIVSLGDKEFLGYSGDDNWDPKSSQPLKWLVFYLEGLLGDWAFISPELYAQKRGSSGTPGRFGEGFLISRDEFDKEGWDKIVSFDSVRHPFSGMSPLNIFTEALNEFKLKPFIVKAIKFSKEGKRL